MTLNRRSLLSSLAAIPAILGFTGKVKAEPASFNPGPDPQPQKGDMEFLAAQFDAMPPVTVPENLSRIIDIEVGGGFQELNKYLAQKQTGIDRIHGLPVLDDYSNGFESNESLIAKGLWPTFIWSAGIFIGFTEMEKYRQRPSLLRKRFNGDIAQLWDKTIETIIFRGFGGAPGLGNRPPLIGTSFENEIMLHDSVLMPESLIGSELAAQAGENHAIHWVRNRMLTFDGQLRAVAYRNHRDSIQLKIPQLPSRGMIVTTTDHGGGYQVPYYGCIGTVMNFRPWDIAIIN